MARKPDAGPEPPEAPDEADLSYFDDPDTVDDDVKRRRRKGVGPKLKAVHIQLDATLYERVAKTAEKRGMTNVARIEELLRLGFAAEAEGKAEK